MGQIKGARIHLHGNLDIGGKTKLPPSVLVETRSDRGTSVLSQQELAKFCQRYSISGGYLSTSAKTGEGLEQLLTILKEQIAWGEMTTTVTTRTFKRIKDFVLTLKEEVNQEHFLVNPDELRQHLQSADEAWRFTDAEMMTAIGHLETHGYVSILKDSSGEAHILLVPDLLVDLASSIVLLADKNPHELGAVSETKLLQGHYLFDELAGLRKVEQNILLDAAVLRFLEHYVCFRESLGNETLLIFPGLIKQKRPLKDDVETLDDISYIVRGRVENIYPALVVLLGFTRTFTRVNQWQRQAQYEMRGGAICGFRVIEDFEGEIELALYYSTSMPDFGRRKFQGLFEEFLYQRDVEVTPFPPVCCPDNHLQERSTVVKRIREGKSYLFCEECGGKIDLPTFERPVTGAGQEARWLRHEEALVRLRNLYEGCLTRVKGFRRDRTTPRCYISHLPLQANWVARLSVDLRDAGIHIVTKRSEITSDDFILIADTPAYQQTFQRTAEPLTADAAIIRTRLGQDKKSTIVRLLIENSRCTSTTKNIRLGDFSRESYYTVSLFGLVLTLYAISHDQPAFSSLHNSLHQQWEDTLSSFSPEKDSPLKQLKIFISYAHEDSKFKDDLVIMLASMQRRGIIDAWQDRRIEPGDEWYQEIEQAMNQCDLALMLVSKNFLASRFIQDEELPHLLERRRAEGMRVVPVIIRPCMWNSEPVLQDLQALPQDGRAVITFPEETGERDQVWVEIAQVIEDHARALRIDYDVFGKARQE